MTCFMCKCTSSKYTWHTTACFLLVIFAAAASDSSADSASVRLSLWSFNHEKCTKSTTHCIPIPPDSNRTCLGNRLPYKTTSPHPLVDDVPRYDLELWTALRAIPACWDKLQFFLCSVYMPECIESVQSVSPGSGTNPIAAMNRSSSGTILNPALAPLNLLEPTGSGDRQDDGSVTAQNVRSYHVVLPEAEMCEAVHKACPLLVPFSRAELTQREDDQQANLVRRPMLLHPLPRFLHCSLYTPGCRQNKLTARLFQSSGGGCEAPLIKTSVRPNWLNGIERCSFPCRRPLFDAEHYFLARWITGTATVICLFVNLIVLATLKLQNRERMTFVEQFASCPRSSESGMDLFRVLVVPNADRPTTAARSCQTKVVLGGRSSVSTGFPWSVDPALFYIHVCFLLGCLAWLVPLFPGWGELIACREDGTVRTGEPQVSSGKTVLCVLNFILLYFPLMSVCVWSNVLDYTLANRIQQVIQHLHITLETPGTSSRACCPKQLVASTPTELPSVEQFTRHRGHDTGGREASSRQSSRHRRSKATEPTQPPTSIACPSVSTQSQHHQPTIDGNSKSPVDTSESTSTAPLAGSTVTQVETPMSQSISESSPSAADLISVLPVTDTRSGSQNDHPPSDDHPALSSSEDKPVATAGKHKSLITRATKKKYKHSRKQSDRIDDERLPLSQFPGDQHLGDSQWSLVDQHYRSLLASFMTSSPGPGPLDHNPGGPMSPTDLELRPREDWSGFCLPLPCSFCHDPLCPTVPRPLTFHAITSTLMCKSRTLQSRCDRHAHLRRKHGPGPGTERDCAACFGASPVGLEAAVRTHPIPPQPQPLPSSPQSACLHLLAFAVPLVLTLIGLTAAEIDGDALSGICFVGRVNVWARVGLVLIPCAVCLLVKCVYLGRVMRSCMRLRRPFLRSPFSSDQEFAQRLVRCTYSYGVFLFVLIGLWLFSVAVQAYTFIGEPVWLESQTALILCQISHRLLGLDNEAALTACLGSAPVTDSSAPVYPDTYGSRIARDESSLVTGDRLTRAAMSFALPVNAVSPLPTTVDTASAARDSAVLLGRLSPYTPSPAQIQKPMAGPILLHLLTFFVLNVIFASMCLFDASVKRSWCNFWCRLRVSCRLARWRGQLPTKRNLNYTLAINKLLSNCLYNNTVGFSWWDPGLFRVPLFHEDPCHISSSAKETSSTCELVPPTDILSSSDLKSRSLGPGDRSVATDVANTSSSKARVEADGLAGGDGLSTFSEHRTRTITTGLTRAEFPVGTVDFGAHPGSAATPFDDLLPHVARVISLYEHTAPDHPTLVFFRHLYDQLVQPANFSAATTTTTTTTTTSSSSTDHRRFDRPATASGLEGCLNTISRTELATSGPPAQSNLVRSMAALYDQCQKQLVAVNNSSTRHRSRHRRLLPSRASARRKSHSRSLSTGGLYCPGSTSLRLSGTGGASTGAGSTVSATSEQPDESLPELLRAAASVLAAAATGSVRGPTDATDLMTGGAGSDRDTRYRHRRLSQSVVSSALSTQQLNQSSGVTSAFGGSQVSSSSIRSALTELHGTLPKPSGRTTQSEVNASTGPDPSGNKSSSGRPLGDEMGTLGSRMSLRSLSCASSSGAESYNSYRLLVNQAGASWRELWRTRMLLMDVLRWAEAVAPLAQANGSATPEAQLQEPASPPATDPVDWNTRFASFLAAALMPGRQACSETNNSSLPQTLAQPASTVPQQQLPPPHPLSSLKIGNPGTMDPMMAAAFAAATAAAATVAMQQQQQQFQAIQPPSMSPLSGSGPSSAQTQASRSQMVHSQHTSAPPMAANIAPGTINEFPTLVLPASFKPTYAGPHSHQTTPVGSAPGPLHPECVPGFGPVHATAYPFDLSTPCTPRFHPLSPPYAPATGFMHPLHTNSTTTAFHLPYGAPWPAGTSMQAYPRQTLSAPDRMIHQYPPPPPPPPGLEEDMRHVQHPAGSGPLRYRGPPDLLVDHAAHGGRPLPQGARSGLDPRESLRFGLGTHAAYVAPPLLSDPNRSQTFSQLAGTELPHGSGSHSLPLLRSDRTSSLAERSGTHVTHNTMPLMDPQKPVPSDEPVLKPPVSASARRDLADSDAFDSEDEVMSDENETMGDVALMEYPATGNHPTATYVPFPSALPNSVPGVQTSVSAAYFLPPHFHSIPLAPDPSLGYLCSGPTTELIRSSPLTYSPGPLPDDGDVSSVSQSASQVPARPSSSSSSDSPGQRASPRLEAPVLGEPNDASNPDSKEGRSANNKPIV